MRRATVALLIVMFVAGGAYAQTGSPKKEAKSTMKKSAADEKEVSGKIMSVAGDLASGGSIVVDAEGKQLTLKLTPTSKLFDAKFTAATVTQLKKGENVKVKYSTTNKDILALHLKK